MFCKHNKLKNACGDCLREENALLRKTLAMADRLADGMDHSVATCEPCRMNQLHYREIRTRAARKGIAFGGN